MGANPTSKLIRHFPLRRLAGALTAEARGRKAYFRQLVVCRLGKFKACSSDVLFQVFDRRGSGNWQNHLGPLEQPRQSDLQGACIEILGNFLYGIMRLLRLA